MKNPLGQAVSYPTTYTPELLFPIERSSYRSLIGSSSLPLRGSDLWRCYEFSWLQQERPPAIAVIEILVPADSPRIVESKSLKLYLGSFAQSSFATFDDVRQTIERDISAVVGARVEVLLLPPIEWASKLAVSSPRGECIDTIAVGCSVFEPDPSLLRLSQSNEVIESGNAVIQRWYSELLRTRCPVTQQPDWGTVEICIAGPRIEPASLIQYIVSFREHLGFHEECCERIFTDISRAFAPDALSVLCSFTRRGGIDISPLRYQGSTELLGGLFEPRRLVRQ
jgi:7-cyano-7-deazaguanine reductase